MVVKQYGPEVDIKISGRESTDWESLKGDFVAVSTHRELNSPAGAWALTLVSKRDNQGRTWAKRIRPMDYVEIRFGRYKKRGEKPQIIMRALVDQVTETIGISAEGQPQRQVTISGKDLGKLLLIKQIFILPNAGEQSFLAQSLVRQGLERVVFADLYDKFTDQTSTDSSMSCQEFLDAVKKFIFEATSSDAQGNSATPDATGTGPTNLNKNIPELRFTAKDMDDLKVIPANLTTFQGSVWNLLTAFQGVPVCELIVQDYEEYPEVLWRWAPYKDKDGKIIPPASEPHSQSNQGPGTVEISTEDIQSYALSTSDQDLYDFYFVEAELGGAWQPLLAAEMTADPGKNPLIRRDLIDRYGYKPLLVKFPLLNVFGTANEEQRHDMEQDWQKVCDKVCDWLDKAFSNGVNLENGTLVLKGDERVEVGTYMKIKETSQEFYIQSVRHDFMLNPPRFTTTLQVTRGLWLENNPYPDDSGSSTGGTTGGTNTTSSQGTNPTVGGKPQFEDIGFLDPESA
jgi:hypothetical protein